MGTIRYLFIYYSTNYGVTEQMGIVVTVTMLIGLLSVFSSPDGLFGRLKLTQATAMLLLLMGLWNSCWYGLQHLTSFWGLAALISGIAMVGTAGILLLEKCGLWHQQKLQIINGIKWLKWSVLMILLVSFLLYSTTLIRLNLGYSIP